MLESSVDSELIFVCGIRCRFSFILLCIAVQFPQCHLLKRLSFPLCIFSSPLSWINWLYVCVDLFLGLDSVPSVRMSVCVSAPCCFVYYNFVIYLKSGRVKILTLFSLNCDMAGCGFTWILELFFFYFWKKYCWDFDRDDIESVDCFGEPSWWIFQFSYCVLQLLEFCLILFKNDFCLCWNSHDALFSGLRWASLRHDFNSAGWIVQLFY